MSQPATPAITRGSPKRFDMAAFAGRRLKAIVVLGGMLFAVLLPAAMFKASVFYETSGKILLAREMPQITGRSDEFNIANYFHDYARTQVERIKSAITLEAALESLPEDVRKAFLPKDVSISVAVSRLQKTLTVAQIPNTHVIQIQITGDEPRGLADMINAVMDTYMLRLRHEEENKDSRRLEFLTMERDALGRDISEWTARVGEIVRTTKTSPDQDQNDIVLRRVMQLQDAYLRAYNEYLQAEKEYQQVQVESEQLRKVSNKVLADDMVAGDQALWRTTSWTYEKLQELRASIDGIAKGNPDRQYIEKRMEAMQDYEQKQRREVRENAERIVNEKREYEINRRLITVESAFRVKEKTERDLKAELDAGLAELETNSMRVIQGKELLRNIENSKKKYFDLEGRIRDLQLDAKAPLRVSIESYAIAPESPAGSNLRKLVMMMLMVSLGLVGAAFFIYDFTDSRVRSPKDIQNLMGSPPTWPISAYATAPGRPEEFARASLDEPYSREAKAVRSLAVRLNKERIEKEAKVAIFTGIHDGAGATSLILNAAHSMRNFCEKVLVIDGNALRPEILSLAGLEPKDGRLDSVFNSTVDLEHCMIRDQKRDLDILVLGRGPWSQEHFRRLPELFGKLRERYEFIFIDAAPVLSSDLTEALAVLSDVCVLVVQGDRTLYSALAWSAEILLRLEVPALATVLNWGGPKPITRLGSLASRLPWPWISDLLARGSRLSGKSILFVACAGAALLAAELGTLGLITSIRQPDNQATTQLSERNAAAQAPAAPQITQTSPPAPLSAAGGDSAAAFTGAKATAAESPGKVEPPVAVANSPAPGFSAGDDTSRNNELLPAHVEQTRETAALDGTEPPERASEPAVQPSQSPAAHYAQMQVDAANFTLSNTLPVPASEIAKTTLTEAPSEIQLPEQSSSVEKLVTPRKKSGTIKKIEIGQKANELVVLVSADQPVGRITWFYRADSGRLVLDVRGEWRSSVDGNLAVSGGHLSHAKVGRHPDRIRLLLEWSEIPAGEPRPIVESTSDGARVRIVMGSSNAGL